MRPVFPYHVMEGTTLYEGLVKPAVDNSSKHAGFIFVPAIQLMLNYLSGNVRIAMQETTSTCTLDRCRRQGNFSSHPAANYPTTISRRWRCPQIQSEHAKHRWRVIVMQAGSSEGFGLAISNVHGKHADPVQR